MADLRQLISLMSNIEPKLLVFLLREWNIEKYNDDIKNLIIN